VGTYPKQAISEGPGGKPRQTGRLRPAKQWSLARPNYSNIIARYHPHHITRAINVPLHLSIVDLWGDQKAFWASPTIPFVKAPLSTPDREGLSLGESIYNLANKPNPHHMCTSIVAETKSCLLLQLGSSLDFVTRCICFWPRFQRRDLSS